MILTAPRTPLVLTELPPMQPQAGQVRLRVEACGVCRTDLHVVDGDLPHPKLPLIPGHEIVGRITEIGPAVSGFSLGQRIGVPWLGRTCGACRFCRAQQENLCDAPQFTGYSLDGGYAQECLADADYVIPLSEEADPFALAPLLCAGLIGYRALKAAGDADIIGLYGFGAAAHIIAQVAVAQGRRVLAFARPGDRVTCDFALSLGAAWAGGSDETPPHLLDAALIFAPDGSLVPRALRAVRKGGSVVCAGIHMSDIPAFPYADLWGERVIRSIANLTRADGAEFMALASRIPLATHVSPYSLKDANRALDDLRSGRLQGAAVLVP
ncbi:zinc-dependent alcohol dehydrogenase family protein [Paracoccus benzoatiresistens]|uniref:Zinc-dependent alcohol dehydrogenase family protein n=1 Tax=Paracoccus benzoatiresistens TaxID=2997341 RepID=A0ABT4JBN5_9RHOB|nr:zinc-dependent alcohol dehydrogenase family protein [Paracoccus sp. EF6]MCZ0963743.1 zinc-dependent alcohol dehydrogenase family protein [Paracoccus sp. EF6]